MLKNIDDTKRLIWEEIIKEAQKSMLPLQENEITAKLFSEKSKLGYSASYRFLENGVTEGKFDKRHAILNGHKTTIYFPVSQQSLA